MKSIVTAKDMVGITKTADHQEIQIKGNTKVKKAIRALAQFGRITFSREQDFKSSHYTFHFFKPVQGLRNLYNLGNEVLVLCCSDGMQDFKSRTKDFLDYLLTTKGEFKNRLDRVTCFLIDETDRICDIVDEDRKNNPETRIIVPFCLDELQNGIDESEFLNRMREFLYERDLFGIASPLQNDMLFFGKDRSNVISELYGKYKQGEQGGLFGLRRIGKTSVLNLLCLKIRQDQGIAVYFDCSSLHHQRWNDLLRYIIQSIYDQYIVSKSGNGVSLSNPVFSFEDIDERYQEKKAASSFQKDIAALYKLLGEKRLLFVFDEIESISYTTSPSKHWGKENDALYFWQVLRSIIQMNNSYISFIIAGVNPKCVEISRINDFDNPIFGIFRPIYISLFDHDDIKSMVSGIGGHLGLNFEEAVYSKLVDDFGGHPFLARQVCSKINYELLEAKEKRPFLVTKYRYDSHRREYQLGISEVIEQILTVLKIYYLQEFELLKKLALDGRNSFHREIGDREKMIQHLLGYCLLDKDNGEYFIRIKSIERYLQDQYINDKTLNTQEDKRMRINIRRDKIEKTLRTIVLYNLRSKYGSKAKDKLFDTVKGTTTDATQELKMRNGTLKDSVEELYFSQLKTVMLKEWKDYQAIFSDKTKFEQFFDLMNRSRNVAAHGKPISDEDEALYHIAFQYFEKNLADY